MSNWCNFEMVIEAFVKVLFCDLTISFRTASLETLKFKLLAHLVEPVTNYRSILLLKNRKKMRNIRFFLKTLGKRLKIKTCDTIFTPSIPFCRGESII